jgi:predicted Fe-S protein YdhL (DUF1289 family)
MRPQTASGPSICSGCFRTIDEIIAWAKLSDEAKRSVWLRLPLRGMADERLSWMKRHAAD